MTKNELIARGQFIYLNSRGKKFVIERMIENGIARNEVEAEFDNYKKSHYDTRDSERESWFSIKWSMVGLVILFIALKSFGLASARSNRLNIDDEIEKQVKVENARCPIYSDPITCLKSIKINSKIITCTYNIEKLSDEEILNAKKDFSDSIALNVNKKGGFGNSYFVILENGYIIKYVVNNESGKEIFSIVKSKDSISSKKIILSNSN